MSIPYLEDVYINFFEFAIGYDIISSEDYRAAKSFYELIVSDKSLTEKQGNLAHLFLKKYLVKCIQHNFDYTQNLSIAIWRKEFRVIDHSKKVFVEKDEDNNIFVCLKFPYDLINVFEEEIKTTSTLEIYYTNFYNRERKLKIIPIYDINIIKLNDFVTKYNFEIDPSFETLVSYIEDIWQNESTIKPCTEIKNNSISLCNYSEFANKFFNENRTNDYFNDLFLAKVMGYPLKTNSNNIFEKLCSYDTNLFYIDTIDKLFQITEKINGTIAILIDKSIDTEKWITNYSNVVDSLNINRNKTRVCFREPIDYKPNFNSMIKEMEFTGSLKNAKYYIFKHKPAKWLIKDIKNIKIIVTTSAFKISNQSTEFWTGNHPCIVFLNEFKPSFGKGINIVEL